MDGPGLKELWSVNKGLGLALYMAGLGALLQGLAGVWIFGRSAPDTRDPHLFGFFCGCAFCLVLLLSASVSTLTAENNLIHDLGGLDPNDAALYGPDADGHWVKHAVRSELGPENFDPLLWMAATMGALQVGVAAVMFFARRSVVAFSGATGGVVVREARAAAFGASDVGDAFGAALLPT